MALTLRPPTSWHRSVWKWGALTRAAALSLSLAAIFLAPQLAHARDVYTNRVGVSVAPLVAVRSVDKLGGYAFDPNTRDVKPEFARRLQRHGFDFVRLVINPLPMITGSEEDRTKARTEVLQVVDTYNSAGLSVIVDMHFWTPNPGAALASAFSDQQKIAVYGRAMTLMAAELARRPSHQVALELLNEPPRCDRAGSMNWLAIQPILVSQVRAVAKSLPLVVTGCRGQLDGLIALNEPTLFKDPNIIYTFHFYEPFIFTHQLVYCNGCGDIYYPQDAGDVAGAVRASGSRVSELRAYFIDGANREFVSGRLSQVSRWARMHNISPSRVFLGEFGAIVGPPPHEETMRMNELAWLKDVRTEAERAGFSYAFWSFPNRPEAFDFDIKSEFLRSDVLRAIGSPK